MKIALDTALRSKEEEMAYTVYQHLLESWNQQNAEKYAACFAEEANVIGFDGSQMNGREEIFKQIHGIFAHHQVAAYVSIVREIRLLSPGIVLLRATAGMVPPGKSEIRPEGKCHPNHDCQNRAGSSSDFTVSEYPCGFSR
jgi:uncharacterized protein (TIGR02246 family)